jgi:orotate phosphoribosyltransferase
MQSLGREMPKLTGQPQRIKEQIIRLLIDSGAYDPFAGFINIDRVWQNPRYLEEFSQCLGDYIRSLELNAEITAIVATETVQFPFGCIPIAACVARDLGLPFVVWEENAVIMTANSRLSGLKDNPRLVSVKEREGFLILQEAVRFGAAPLKAISDLYDEKCVPKMVLAIVDTEQSEDLDQIIRKKAKEITRKEVSFRSILKTSDLKAALEKR